jgi:hypothetical protein
MRECDGLDPVRVARERLQRRPRDWVPQSDRPVPGADARNLPSCENATAMAPFEWPTSVCSAAPVARSHSLTVLSQEADARSLPSCENATASTQFEWPASVRSAAPVVGSQSLTVLSKEADARSLPSCENATASTEPE